MQLINIIHVCYPFWIRKLYCTCVNVFSVFYGCLIACYVYKMYFVMFWMCVFFVIMSSMLVLSYCTCSLFGHFTWQKQDPLFWGLMYFVLHFPIVGIRPHVCNMLAWSVNFSIFTHPFGSCLCLASMSFGLVKMIDWCGTCFHGCPVYCIVIIFIIWFNECCLLFRVFLR